MSDSHPYHEACPQCWARFESVQRRAEKAESRVRELEAKLAAQRDVFDGGLGSAY